jgi:hypothetical protein
METWYCVFANDKRGAREVARSRTTDFGEAVRISQQWTEISHESGRNCVYAIACVLPLGIKGRWSKEQIDEFCSLTPEEAFSRLRSYDSQKQGV